MRTHEDDARDLAKDIELCNKAAEANAALIAAATVGWPAAIRRAMKAEAELARLRNQPPRKSRGAKTKPRPDPDSMPF